MMGCRGRTGWNPVVRHHVYRPPERDVPVAIAVAQSFAKCVPWGAGEGRHGELVVDFPQSRQGVADEIENACREILDRRLPRNGVEPHPDFLVDAYQ